MQAICVAICVNNVGGRSIDLNDLVDPSLTLLTSAAGLSNNGKIVASGLNGHLYVLTPK
jgi:hypothetical protein